ncbi:MAG: ATP-binding protein [Chloroflexi bacterium]|nr:ATP-binding protein [Chloroflexota bacterium]
MRSKASDNRPVAEVSATLPATAEHLDRVYATLSQFWTELERSHPAPPDGVWRAYFDTAVGEIVTNIIRYAYASTAAGGEMSMAIQGYLDRVEATFRDRGGPYTGAPITDARLPLDSLDVIELPEGGWGLALTLAAVDRLSYTRDADVNYWHFMKKL